MLMTAPDMIVLANESQTEDSNINEDEELSKEIVPGESDIEKKDGFLEKGVTKDTEETFDSADINIPFETVSEESADIECDEYSLIDGSTDEELVSSYDVDRWQVSEKGVTQERCTYRVWHEAYDRGIVLPTNWGNAGTWAANARAQGYSVDYNPSANSIVCWVGGAEGWGHVAYVTGVDSTNVYIREAGIDPVNGRYYQDTSYRLSYQNRWSGYTLQGYIHLSGPTPSVSFTPWSNDNYTYIRETDASIGMEINVSGGTCTSEGMYLYDSNGSYLASASNPTHTLARVCFQVNAEMGYTLRGGTTYKYKFYAVVNGQTYWSNEYSFTTSPPAVTNINNCTVTLSATSYTYNGSARTPSVTVKNGSTTLTSGTNYTVSYSNNVNAGTATVAVTGKGYYTGTVYRSFNINKAVATLSFDSASINKTDLNTTFTNSFKLSIVITSYTIPSLRCFSN